MKNFLRLLWIAIGIAAGISLALWLVQATTSPLFLASLGGSAVFLFGLTRAPAAQPRALFGGHLTGALVGITCYQLFGDALWVYAASAVVAGLLMLVLKAVHPPAGANPLIMIHAHATWSALLHPVLLGVLALAVVAAIWSRLYPGMARYPVAWFERPPPPRSGAVGTDLPLTLEFHRNYSRIPAYGGLMRTLHSLALPVAAIMFLAIAGCSKSQPPAAQAAGKVDGARIVAAENNAEWLSYGRTYSEQRFSPLTKVTRDNVGTLGLAWYHEFDANSDRGMEATPLIVDGVLYVSTSWSRVHALDAKTGTLKWSYDPAVDGQKARDACCDVVNRGVAIWNGRVYVGALDGRLIALDAATGKEVWSVQTTDTAWPYTITGAPRVIKGKVLIGNGGAELGVRGFVSAYDAETGALSWRFYVTPNPEGKPDGAASDRIFAEKAAGTWYGDGWKKTGGGGTVWDAITYDPATDLVYVGTGNGSPWSHKARSDGKGDNLFLSSILALKPDTGEYVWHYQTTPGDSWDYTATQHIMTADLTINGEKRHVVMQAPKNGFFYVLDAATGKLISAEKYAGVNWAEKIDVATGRPVDNPATRYLNGGLSRLAAGPNGGHTWQPMAFNPQEGLVYIPAHRDGFTYKHDPRWQFVRGRWNLALEGAFGPLGPPDATPEAKLSPAAEAARGKLPAGGGYLIAWDPVKQEPRWITPEDNSWTGGVLATASGLVFAGSDQTFNAYDAATGKKIWTDKTAAAVMAAPATYEIDGEQYITVTVGYGGANAMIGGRFPRRPGRVHVYKLGGTVKAPEFAPSAAVAPIDLAKATASGGNAANGGKLMADWCLSCHIGGIFTPDLSRSTHLYTAQDFAAVVNGGSLKPRGMASFAQWLSEKDVEDIRAFLLNEAKKAR